MVNDFHQSDCRHYKDLYRRLDLELSQLHASSALRLTRHGLNTGKLEFYAHLPFQVDVSAHINASLDTRTFSIDTQVIACRPKVNFYIVELEIQKENAFQARIFLQLSAIANYKHHADNAGRLISIDQAACEWIDLHAENFAAEFDRRVNDSIL